MAIGIVHNSNTTEPTTTAATSNNETTSTSSTTTTTSPTTTTTLPTQTTTDKTVTTEKTYANELERFFASDYNKATYLVLPAMILIYGGCSVIYCVAKLRRYMRRRERQKRRELLEQRNVAFEANDDKEQLTEKDVDRTFMFTAPKQPVSTYTAVNKDKNWMPEKAVAMEVAEIDKQLKQAFAMISNVTYDIREKRLRQMKSKPDLLPTEQENETSIKKKRKYKQRAYMS